MCSTNITCPKDFVSSMTLITSSSKFVQEKHIKQHQREDLKDCEASFEIPICR